MRIVPSRQAMVGSLIGRRAVAVRPAALTATRKSCPDLRQQEPTSWHRMLAVTCKSHPASNQPLICAALRPQIRATYAHVRQRNFATGKTASDLSGENSCSSTSKTLTGDQLPADDSRLAPMSSSHEVSKMSYVPTCPCVDAYNHTIRPPRLYKNT